MSLPFLPSPPDIYGLSWANQYTKEIERQLGGLNQAINNIVSGGDLINVTLPPYNADNTGTVSAVSAINLALSTGQGIWIPIGDYLIDGALLMPNHGQSVYGEGQGVNFILDGTFDVWVISGTGCLITNISYTGTNHTGFIQSIEGGNRTIISNQTGSACYNWGYVEGANQTTFQNIWSAGHRGDAIFHLYGDPALRSDVVVFENVTCSADSGIAIASRATGLLWDGNVHTVDTNGLRFVTPRRGVWTQNTGGGSFPNETPAFARFNNFQVDFPGQEAIYLETGWDMNFMQPYTNNSVEECGIYIGTNCSLGSIVASQTQANAKEGMVIEGTDFQIIGCNVAVNSLSSLGTYSGIRTTSNSRRIEFSGTHSGLRAGTGAVQAYGWDNESGSEGNSWYGGYLGGNLIEAWRNDAALTNDNFAVSAIGSAMSVISNLASGTASGWGATLSGTIVAGAITAVSVVDSGYWYSGVAQVFAFDPTGSGSGFTGTVNLNANGTVASITVNTTGSLYDPDTILYIRQAGGEPYVKPYYPGSNINLMLRGTGSGGLVGENDQGTLFSVVNVPNSVNSLQAIAGATASPVILSAAGTDTDISLGFVAKSAGFLYAANGGGLSFLATAAPSSVNYLTFSGQATGNDPTVSATGTDANINLALIPKGTGTLVVGGPTAGAAGALAGYLIIEHGGTQYKLQLYAV